MSRKALFPGLVFDELDRPAEIGYVGEDPCYVLNDDGFKRHIPSQQIDRQVLAEMVKAMRGNEEQISEQTAKMLGSDDPFSRAMIANQLKMIDQQFEALFNIGIPEDMRAYLGMTGLKIIVDYQGNLIRLEQPSAPDDSGGE